MSMVASAYIDINYFRINYDLDEIERKYIHVCVCVFLLARMLRARIIIIGTRLN